MTRSVLSADGAFLRSCARHAGIQAQKANSLADARNADMRRKASRKRVWPGTGKKRKNSYRGGCSLRQGLFWGCCLFWELLEDNSFVKLTQKLIKTDFISFFF